MTSQRQRPAGVSPPISSHGAALLGALSAFAKSTPNATGHASVTSRQAPVPPRKKSHLSARPHSGTTVVSNDPKQSARPTPSVSNPGTAVPAPRGASTGIPKTALDTKSEVQPRSSPRTPSQASARLDTDTKSHHGDRPDTDSLPSTTSLIQLFENTTPSAVRGVNLHTPKATRPSSLLLQKDDKIALSMITTSNNNSSPPTEAPQSGKSEKTDLSSPASFSTAKDFLSPSKVRPASTINITTIQEAPKPAVPVPIPRKASAPRRTSHDVEGTSPAERSFSHSPHFASHSNPTDATRAPSMASIYGLPSAATSTASITATYNALHPRRQSVLRTDDALANAIVASSLASSRAPSPMILPNPPHTIRPRHSHGKLFSRTPSPHKLSSTPAPTILRQTLRPARNDSSDSSADDPYHKHKRKRHIRKHANKYHEGDRKRWRNAVTDRERARYEGVWAANRGLLPSTPDDAVHALAAKEIWGRSRLAPHVLQEIWGLVAPEGVPYLGREEFVVGLWLVDQRLRGRKLPVRVQGSVWESVRMVKGIRIRHREVGRSGW